MLFIMYYINALDFSIMQFMHIVQQLKLIQHPNKIIQHAGKTDPQNIRDQ